MTPAGTSALVPSGTGEDARRRLLNLAVSCRSLMHVHFTVVNVDYPTLMLPKYEGTLREQFITCIRKAVAGAVAPWGIQPEHVSVRLVANTNHTPINIGLPVRVQDPWLMRQSLIQGSHELARTIGATVQGLALITDVASGPISVDGFRVAWGLAQPEWQTRVREEKEGQSRKGIPDAKASDDPSANSVTHFSVSNQVPELRQHTCATLGLRPWSMLSGSGGLAQNVAADFEDPVLMDLHCMLHAINV